MSYLGAEEGDAVRHGHAHPTPRFVVTEPSHLDVLLVHLPAARKPQREADQADSLIVTS